MAKDLVIKDFISGIGSSPHTGFGDMRNLDIHTIPGVARLNYATTKQSGTIVTGLMKWQVESPQTRAAYGLDENGVVYTSGDNGASWSVVAGNTASQKGQGLAIWNDYLIVMGTTIMDIYGPLSTSPGWIQSFKTGIDSDQLWHPLLVSNNDGDLYGGAGRYVFRLSDNQQDAVFTVTIATPAVFSHTAHGLVAGDNVIFSSSGALPTGLTAGKIYYVIAAGLTADAFEVSATSGGSAVNTSGSQSGTHTYKSLTWTPRALDLPLYYKIKCLAELGNNLEIGTWMGSTIQDMMVADLFPWDRTSPSYGQPLQFKLNGINQMIAQNDRLYIQAGIDGQYFVSDGIQYAPIGQIPDSIVDLEGNTKFFDNYPGAMSWFKERLMFGTAAGSSDNLDGQGVWSIKQTPSGYVLNFENVISTGVYGSATNIKIGSLLSFDKNNLFIGWKSGTSYGVDKTGVSPHYASYTAFFESPLYHVGTPLVKEQYTQIEFELARKLASGDGIKLYYRTNLTDSFTQFVVGGNLDFAALGAVMSANITADAVDCEFIQIRCEITSTGASTPQLRSITLR